MSESVYDGGADTEASKGAGARHEGDLGEVLKIFATGLELVVDVGKKLLGEVVAEVVGVFLIVDS